MRQRFQRLQRIPRFRGRGSMARRPGAARRLTLTPGQRRLAGWIAAIGIVGAIALVVGLLGGNADGSPVAPGAGASPSNQVPVPIEFGTAIDATTGEVAATARVTRFEPDDTFAYSVRPGGALPDTIYVEVIRLGDEAGEVVQAIPGDGEQALPPDAEVIAFSVPGTALFEAFGPGSYEMRIHLDPADSPIAVGRFELADPAAPSGTGTAPSP